MSTLKVDTILKRTGTGTITVGQSGDTIAMPSVTLTTALPIAQGGTGGTSFAAAGLANAPNFRATLSATTSALSASTWTKISPNTEAYDSNSAYTGGTFTVPSSEGGLYFIYGTAMFSATAVNRPTLAFYVNGSRVFTRSPFDENIDVSGYQEVTISATLNLSATNTVELYAFTSVSSVAIYGDSTLRNNPASFGAYKLIG